LMNQQWRRCAKELLKKTEVRGWENRNGGTKDAFGLSEKEAPGSGQSEGPGVQGEKMIIEK